MNQLELCTSPVMRTVRELITRVAATNAAVRANKLTAKVTALILLPA